MRTDYTGNTLRENLGLERPDNLFTTPAAETPAEAESVPEVVGV